MRITGEGEEEQENDDSSPDWVRALVDGENEGEEDQADLWG